MRGWAAATAPDAHLRSRTLVVVDAAPLEHRNEVFHSALHLAALQSTTISSRGGGHSDPGAAHLVRVLNAQHELPAVPLSE